MKQETLEEKLMDRLNEMAATVELAIKDWNVLVNVLNTPNQADTLLLAQFINEIQKQVNPQAVRGREALMAVKNSDGVPKEFEERN
jgi:hypothetical protein